MNNRAFLFLAVAAPCVGLVVWKAVAQWWITDDALITFRYVENLVAGHGLVYNHGERVEGLSNPLFALLLAPFAAAGADLFEVAPVFGIVASAAEAALLVWIVLRATGSPFWSGLGGALFASDRIVAVWATSGLETALHGALVLGAFAAARVQLDDPELRRSARLAPILHALAAVSRPEGLAFAVPYLALVGRRDRRVALRAALFIAVPVLAVVAARLAYYGQPLPNTFYAKVGGVPTLDVGLAYIAGFARRIGWAHPLHVLPWLGLVAGVAWAVRTGARDRAGAALSTAGAAALYAAVALAAVVAEGGDYMTDFRMLRPVMGILFAAVACALGAIELAHARRGLVAGAAIASALLVSHVIRQNEGSAIAWDAPPAVEHKRILSVDRARAERFAEALMTVARPGDSLLVDLGGLRGYAHRLRTIDATGLVSARPEEDFYLRDDWNEETGGRERLPGHARWPKVSFLERERVTFIFPKVQDRGPDVPEVTERSPRRHRGYPFLHVVAPLPNGRYLRFFTTMDRAEIAARAREKGIVLCARARGAEVECWEGG